METFTRILNPQGYKVVEHFENNVYRKTEKITYECTNR